MPSEETSGQKPGLPPRQQNLETATELGFQALADQTDHQFDWLGAEAVPRGRRVRVLDDLLQIDWAARQITTSAGNEVGPHWRILVLHYLAIRTQPERCVPEVTFADLKTARSYSGVYQGRTVARLCGTVGRDGETLRKAAESLGAVKALGGDMAFDFPLFPRLTFRVIWHAPDEEFPASATILLPGNIESFLCAEDIVVLSERLVARLVGRPF